MSTTDPIDEKNNDNQLRIAVTGGVDSGKTTITGVLVSGELDDGRGYARAKVFRYPHEKSTGRSSSVSYNYIKQQLPDGSRRIITAVDLCGHEAYLRTTLYGITAHRIDYGLVIAGCNMGIAMSHNGSFANSMTAEHVKVLSMFGIPMIYILTKKDLCPDTVSQCNCGKKKPSLDEDTLCSCQTVDPHPEYENTKSCLRKLLKTIDMKPMWVDKETPPEMIAKNAEAICKRLQEGVYAPVIVASNKTGMNIELLKHLLQILPPRPNTVYDPIGGPDMSRGSFFFVESKYRVKGVGLVVSGTLKGATIRIGDHLHIGPIDGKWYPLRVKDLHNNIREPIKELVHGMTGCIAIACKDITTKRTLKSGLMVVTDPANTNTTTTFTAEVTVLKHSTTITGRFQSHIHCLNIRQTARLLLPKNGDKAPLIRSGQTCTVGFKFAAGRAVHIEIGAIVLLREGKTRAVGRITAIGLPPGVIDDKYDDPLLNSLNRTQRAIAKAEMAKMSIPTTPAVEI
jgi:GTPase